jgi:glucose-6-phosphate 1-dehydrogenase
MVQNHLTQLLTLTAMESPAAFEADAIRDEKVKVLRSITPLQPEDIVFGQYATGRIDGEDVPGYRSEEGVAEESQTETFVSMRLNIANWRWQGVPFYLRTGKRMGRRVTQITIQFHEPPVSLFQAYDRCNLQANALVLTLQPDEGFDLFFEVKEPGQDIQVQTQNLHFRYADAFGPLPEGYETLLSDIFTDDQTLFVRADEVEMAWRLYEPLLVGTHTVEAYRAGGWGPAGAFDLLTERGHRWTIR